MPDTRSESLSTLTLQLATVENFVAHVTVTWLSKKLIDQSVHEENTHWGLLVPLEVAEHKVIKTLLGTAPNLRPTHSRPSRREFPTAHQMENRLKVENILLRTVANLQMDAVALPRLNVRYS